MTPSTLTALQASIAHHEDNLKAESPGDVKLGGHYCALCARFAVRHDGDEPTCDGCPVKNATGLDRCDGSPYDALACSHLTWECRADDGTEVAERLRDDFRTAERAEIAFLKSLLPEVAK